MTTIPPIPEPGTHVRLRHAVGGGRQAVVLFTGRCSHSTCGAGDRCCELRMIDGRHAGQSINRTPSDFDVVPAAVAS